MKYCLFLAIAIFFGCGTNRAVTKTFDKVNDLDNMIKDFDFVPFKIPRNGDGVCTIITFEKKSEAVIASKSDCLSNITVDTVYNVVPDFSYTITPNDSAGVDLGKIFGDGFNLKGAFKYARVKKINVKLVSPFEARLTRISVEKEVQNILKSDPICTKNLYSKNNYLIERVFGAHGIEITLQDSVSKAINVDISILKEITSNPAVQTKFNGQSTLKSSSITLFGYRMWKYDGNPGFDGAETTHKEIDIATTINLRSNSR